MSASSQIVRKPKSVGAGEGTDLFPPDVSTNENSLVYVQRVLAVTISSIAYLRNLFGPDSFTARKWSDYRLQLINGKEKNGQFLIKCVAGAFDALKKTYLRELILGIATDPENSDDVVEAYSFKFNYTKNGETSMSVAARTGAPSFQAQEFEHTYDQVNDSMQRLIRHLMVYVETLNTVPKNAFFTMKLLYFDERTPPDYEPPGFEPSDTLDFIFGDIEAPLPIAYGVVETTHHSVKASVRSILMKKNKSARNENVRNVVEVSEKNEKNVAERKKTVDGLSEKKNVTDELPKNKKNDNLVKKIHPVNENISNFRPERTEIRSKINTDVSETGKFSDEHNEVSEKTNNKVFKTLNENVSFANPKKMLNCVSIPVNSATSYTKSSDSNVGVAKKRNIYEIFEENEKEQDFDGRKRFSVEL